MKWRRRNGLQGCEGRGGGRMKEGGYEVMRRKRRRGKQMEEQVEGI